jgi:hypothetical protein
LGIYAPCSGYLRISRINIFSVIFSRVNEKEL